MMRRAGSECLEGTTEELVARARLHDAEAFTELIRRYEGMALSVAYARTRNASDAGDIVQEAFMRAWQRLESLDDASRFGHWLSRMIRNLAIDQSRRNRPGSLDETYDPAADHAGPAPMEVAEQKRQIDGALKGLDELSRECVILRYYENLSSKEIAETLDITPAAVDMRLSRARTQLKERLRTLVEES